MQRLARADQRISAARHAHRRLFALQRFAPIAAGAGNAQIEIVGGALSGDVTRAADPDLQPILIQTLHVGLAAARNIQLVEFLDRQLEDDVLGGIEVRHLFRPEFQRASVHVGLDVGQEIVVRGDRERFGSGLLDEHLPVSAERHGGEARHRSGLGHDFSGPGDPIEHAAAKDHRAANQQAGAKVRHDCPPQTRGDYDDGLDAVSRSNERSSRSESAETRH